MGIRRTYTLSKPFANNVFMTINCRLGFLFDCLFYNYRSVGKQLIFYDLMYTSYMYSLYNNKVGILIQTNYYTRQFWFIFFCIHFTIQILNIFIAWSEFYSYVFCTCYSVLWQPYANELMKTLIMASVCLITISLKGIIHISFIAHRHYVVSLEISREIVGIRENNIVDWF